MGSALTRQAAEGLVLLNSRIAEVQLAQQLARPDSYDGRPVAYAHERLKVFLTPDQERILALLTERPHRVLVPSGHNTGKTFLAAVAISWWFDTYDPGAVFTVGPRMDSQEETIWGEVRRQRARAGLPDYFIGPRAAEMRTSTEHWAKAFTAAKDASLTGRHFRRMLFIFEEAIGVDPIWWEVIMTMFDPSLGHAQLCIFNPTDTESQAYREDIYCEETDGGAPRWHRVRLSALNHPNIASQLGGGPKIIADAVSLEMVAKNIRDMCTPVTNLEDVRRSDIEFPPTGSTADLSEYLGKNRFWRPGPEFQARWLGQWPDTGNGVWSPSLWEMCFPEVEPALPLHRLPEIGVDCSMGKGQDYFALHCRWGAVSLYHETANTMDAVQIQARVQLACERMAAEYNARLAPQAARVSPKKVLVRIDDDGTGNAIAAHMKRDGWTVQLVSVARQSTRPDLYPIMRDEAWFASAEKAAAGLVCLSRLDKHTLARLRTQLLAPTWELDKKGRREVEAKEDTKEKIKRSPDDADAMNLAYLDLTGPIAGKPVDNNLRQPRTDWGDPDLLKVAARPRMYGRGE